MGTPPLPDEDIIAAVEAFRRLGSQVAAAAELGMSRESLQRRLRQAQERGLWEGQSRDIAWQEAAERLGFDPNHGGWLKFPTTDDGPGASVMQPKTAVDAREAEVALAAKFAAYIGRLPAYPLIPAPSYNAKANALDLIVIADAHIGMYAYHREGGARWDVDEAARLIPGAAQILMNRDAKPDRALVVYLGDWRHFERPDAVTQYSGHLLSADTRIAKVQRMAVRLKVAVCDLALTHYRHVEVIDAEGNHDPVSVHADREWLKAVYRAEPRMSIIDRNDLPLYYRRVGGVFLGFHHGDLYPIKSARDRLRLALRCADECADDWTAGRVLRAIHSGHLHTPLAGWCNESGVWYEQHGTMAPRDGHAARHYAQSRRGLTRITYDGDMGETGREVVTPAMVRRMEAA